MTWRSPVIVLVAMTIVVLGRVRNSQELILGQQDTVSKIPLSLGTESKKPVMVESISENFVASPSITPMSSPSAAPESSPTATPTKMITPKPTPTVKPQPVFTPEQVYEFYEKFGILYAIDPDVLRHVAECESGFNPSAKNKIYGGLYQFDSATWINYRTKMGLDTDPDLRYHAEEAIKTASFALSKGAARLWPNCFPKNE